MNDGPNILKTIFILTHVFLLIKGVETPNKCPKDYHLIGESCFFVSDASEKETYEGALLECQAKHGRLYEPRNGVEYIALGHYLKVKTLEVFDSFIWEISEGQFA